MRYLSCQSPFRGHSAGRCWTVRTGAGMRRSPHAPRTGRRVPYDAAMGDSGIRLSDLLVSLSMATDLGLGQPPEHMARSARIGMRLGARLGLDAKDLATLYDVGILTYVGCPVYGNESAVLFGDDIDFRALAIEVDLAGFPAMMFMLRRAGHGTSAFNRARQAAAVMAGGVGRWCSRWPNTARLPARSPLAWDSVMTYGWASSRPMPDGTVKGSPATCRAPTCPWRRGSRMWPKPARSSSERPASKLQSMSSDCGAAPTSTPRSPSSCRPIPSRCSKTSIDDTVDEFLTTEPADRGSLTDEDLDQALEAIGDFCDLRCTFFAGHARGTAELVQAPPG